MSGAGSTDIVYLVIAAVLVAAFGILAVRYLLALFRLIYEVKRPATVVGKRIDPGGKRYLTYAFTDGNGRAHRREVEVPESLFAGLREGGSVRVAYSWAHPERSRLTVAGELLRAALKYVLVLLLGLLLGLLVYRFFPSL